MTKVKMFADDIKLYIGYSDTGSQPVPHDLQNALNRLSANSFSWRLQLNSSKCKVINFSRSRVAPITSYYIGSAQLETVVVAVDLGVTVDSSLRFHSHINIITAKASGLASHLLRTTVNRSPEFMVKLYISNICPIIEFSSYLWFTGYKTDNIKLESIQRRWTKAITGFADLSYHE